MNIYRTDQYYIKYSIKINNQTINDTNSDEVVIKLGDIVKKSIDGDIAYDHELNCWLYFLSIDEANELSTEALTQGWFKINNNYYTTPIKKINVLKSIIKKSEVVQGDNL